MCCSEGVLAVLTACPLLVPLPLDSTCHLVRQCSVARYEAHAVIAKQGQPHGCAMVVLGGTVLEMCDVTFSILPSVVLKGDNCRCCACCIAMLIANHAVPTGTQSCWPRPRRPCRISALCTDCWFTHMG